VDFLILDFPAFKIVRNKFLFFKNKKKIFSLFVYFFERVFHYVTQAALGIGTS
jgi:hypothetical protein